MLSTNLCQNCTQFVCCIVFRHSCYSDIGWYHLYNVILGGISYCLELVLSVLFICFYIHRILISDPFKRIVAWISFGYLLFYLIYSLTHSENFFNGNDMGSFIIGGAVVVISISLYFIELLTVDRVMDFKSSFNLIVLGALFIWWLVIAPTLFYEEYFNVVDLGFLNLRKQILFSCNVLMYGMFSFALAYCKPQNH